jgi:predicted amidohydrolase YtcJ
MFIKPERLITPLLTLATILSAPAAGAAPMLIEHVSGYTLAANQLHRFDAMVFDDRKVVATGHAQDLQKRYPAAQVIDGKGACLLPGLIDAHGHVIDLGFETVQIQLWDTTSLADAQRVIRAYASANPDRPWLYGDGWNQVKWQLGRFPTATELDAVVSDRPVVLSRVDGHAEWVNSRVIQLAGLSRETPDPPGGRIERDAAGNPSGVFVDKAMALIDKLIPEPTRDEQRAALQAAMTHMNSVGLTGVGDAGDPASQIAVYRELADRGQLTVRAYVMILDADADFAALSKSGPLIGYAEDHLTIRSVKLFADGALGSRGAAMLAPYSDMPSQRGLLFMSDAEMEKKIETGLRAGYQVNVHAIGDAANHQVLDGFEAAYKAVPDGRRLRNRIEHAQVVAPSDIRRFKQLDLIASMQPTHATSDKNMAEDRIGKERLEGAYAWRTFLKQGTKIAGGSDFPVESDNPFYGLHAAVTRTDHDNQPPGGWHAEQAMTLEEAFRAFTLDAAYAEHNEQHIGSLEPGKWADFILIDRDLFKIPPADIWKIKVRETWVGGQRVYGAATESDQKRP